MVKPDLSEKEVTKAIRSFLSSLGIWHYKHFNGGFPGRKGVSDIIGIYNGKYLAIEIKRVGNYPTREQRKFLEEVNRQGGIGFVAYGVEDVIKGLSLDDLVLL